MATPTALPSTFTANTVLPAASLNLLRGAFRVLQVVQEPYGYQANNSTTTMADTGLTATITPQYNTSKILVLVQQTFGKTVGNANNAVASQIVRGATAIYQFQVAALYTGTTLDMVGPSTSAIYLDSPATTAATTYKTQFANFTAAAAVNAGTNNASASITLIEISA